MNQHDNLLSASIYGVLAWQFAVTLMAVAGFLWFYGGLAGISVAFGGCGAGAITGISGVANEAVGAAACREVSGLRQQVRY